jgi:hypothetical protein
MKDTVITAKRKKIELISGLVCFVIANFVNLYAIFTYRTSGVEMLTSIGYVVVFSLFLYCVWSLLRIVLWGLKALFRKKTS